MNSAFYRSTAEDGINWRIAGKQKVIRRSVPTYRVMLSEAGGEGRAFRVVNTRSTICPLSIVERFVRT